jgi:thioredoxin reductase (NADPH)
LVTREVKRIDPKTREVFLDDGETIRTRTVGLATGVSWRRLEIEGFDRLMGKGIYYGAAHSEGVAAHGLHVYLIGAGNSAGQAAMDFAKSCAHGDARRQRRFAGKGACPTI